MRNFFVIVFVLLSYLFATAQTVVVKYNNGRIESYDATKIDSITFQNDTPGFTIYNGLIEETFPVVIPYSFETVKSIAANPNPYTGTSEGADILRFSLKSKRGEVFDSFLVNDSTIHICVPHETDLTCLQLDFEHNGREILVDGVKTFSNDTILDVSDFTQPHEISITSTRQDTVSRKLIVYDLPVLMIQTPDGLPIESKTERKEGCVMTLINTNGEIDSLGGAGIKGRGNSTWLQPKKPYNVKLDKKKEILGMMKSKHWLLLSNPYYDPTQLHNDVAFQIARMTNYPWVQSGKFVELILNGKHEGLYYLCEKVRIEKGKIDIAEIKPEYISGDSLTGGYLLEAGLKAKEEISFTTGYYNKTGKGFEYSLVWNLETPEDNVPQEQIAYIKNQFNYLESLIANDETLFSGEYMSFFDIETAINWFLVENICFNQEASRSKNLIVYKDRDSSISGGKLTIGPPWDLDAWTFNKEGHHQLYVRYYTWFYDRLLQDPVFVSRLKEKWDSYFPAWKEQIPDYIDELYDKINHGACRNKVLWADWVTWYYGDKSYKEYVEDMKEAFLSQLEWMNDEIHNM